MVDIYRVATFTDTEVTNCFIIHHTKINNQPSLLMKRNGKPFCYCNGLNSFLNSAFSGSKCMFKCLFSHWIGEIGE